MARTWWAVYGSSCGVTVGPEGVQAARVTSFVEVCRAMEALALALLCSDGKYAAVGDGTSLGVAAGERREWRPGRQKTQTF